MTGRWTIVIGLGWAAVATANPVTDPYVKNLALIGVIHVEGAQAKGQSVAVLRDKHSGRTRMLHKGDRLLDANLELRDLGPQQVTLVRGTQTFILRVESQVESTATLSQVETTDVELGVGKTSAEEEAPTQSEPRRLIPDADCTGDECPALPE